MASRWTSGGSKVRLALGIVLVTALIGVAAPAAADAGTYSCTILVGTRAGGSSGVSATTPAGGAGECHLHELDSRSTLVSTDTPDGCQVFFDADEDGFAEDPAQEGAVYDAGTSFSAFCQVGTALADTSITLADA